MVEKSKPTVHLKPAAPAAKPEQKQAPTVQSRETAQKPVEETQIAGRTKNIEKSASADTQAAEKVPLRAKKTLSEFEKGFLAGVDAAQKTAFEHERAKSTGTPITDAIQNLEPE